MSKETQAILLVADISGYTRFMKFHTISINHAKQIVVRLLKALIKASKPPLKVAELEGDAVFFYALSSEKNIVKTAEQVKTQIIQLFNSFNNELDILKKMDLCKCDACVQAGDLKLKQVVHMGEVELEKIHKSEKLFGLDVIVVHRMLKNSVPSNEYVMMTNPAYTNFIDFYGMKPEPFKENFEGIGEVDTLVFYPDDILNKLGFAEREKPAPSLIEKITWELKIMPRTFLDLLGISKIKGTFSNIPT